MSKLLSVVALLTLSPLGMAGGITILLDNFLTPPDGHDGLTGRSSERNSLVPDSWTCDDVTIETPVVLQGVAWVGYRDAGVTYASAEVIILREEIEDRGAFLLTQVALIENLAPEFNDTLPAQFDLVTYRGVVAGLAVGLPPGHYYVGVRLVDSFLGRNYLATTGGGTMGQGGQTIGIFRSASLGSPEWVFVDELMPATDFAVQLIGQFLLRGDMNCDGSVNVLDINGFVLALMDPAGYVEQFRDCIIENGDANDDGQVNILDINAFIQLILGGG
ncbi:hypothetical protein RAS1_19120 [Phycisphaerae bacterium RAS1]|nr:hypothetical protein RAS1_19120 [Phycisphaerae bacterium RAS1]